MLTLYCLFSQNPTQFKQKRILDINFALHTYNMLDIHSKFKHFYGDHKVAKRDVLSLKDIPKDPIGISIGCKQDTMSQHDYFKKGLHVFFLKNIFSYK
jgi:hypothetical protein